MTIIPAAMIIITIHTHIYVNLLKKQAKGDFFIKIFSFRRPFVIKLNQNLY